MRIEQSLRFLAAASLPLLLTACFPRGDYGDSPDPGVITIRQHSETMTISSLTAPTPAERARVAAHLAVAGDSGVRVFVRLPAGIVVPTDSEARARIRALGIPPSIAVLQPGGARGTETELVFTSYTAEAPDCSAMVTANPSLEAENRPSMAFGCATYSNLAAQVADPADLAVPRAFAGPEGTTGSTAVQSYLDDKVKKLKSLSTSTVGGGSSGSSGN